MESDQAAPNTVGFRRLSLSPAADVFGFAARIPVRGGAWGDAYHTLPVHTQAYVFLFRQLSGAHRGINRRSPLGSSGAQRFEETGSPIERVVEHGLERMAESRIRHELRLA
jgi:hypothetical protein